jgi:hypothetical protein
LVFCHFYDNVQDLRPKKNIMSRRALLPFLPSHLKISLSPQFQTDLVPSNLDIWNPILEGPEHKDPGPVESVVLVPSFAAVIHVHQRGIAFFFNLVFLKCINKNKNVSIHSFSNKWSPLCSVPLQKNQLTFWVLSGKY